MRSDWNVGQRPGGTEFQRLKLVSTPSGVEPANQMRRITPRTIPRTSNSSNATIRAPYVVETGIDLAGLRTATTIFSGGLAEAVRGFPKNVNVAATLFVASGFEDLQVKVIADPAATSNKHEVVCEGDFGRITVRAENKPSANPKTSLLAILSAKRTLDGIVETIHAGT